jgi:DNA-binding IclR family transcriptional regulator
MTKKEESLKSRILNYLNNQEGFCNGGTIEKLAEDAGYKASNASRRCRELVNEGKLQKKISRGQGKVASVWYCRVI